MKCHSSWYGGTSTGSGVWSQKCGLSTTIEYQGGTTLCVKCFNFWLQSFLLWEVVVVDWMSPPPEIFAVLILTESGADPLVYGFYLNSLFSLDIWAEVKDVGKGTLSLWPGENTDEKDSNQTGFYKCSVHFWGLLWVYGVRVEHTFELQLSRTCASMLILAGCTACRQFHF